MSRATWYRYGKPKPGAIPARKTVKDAARQIQTTLRTAERYLRVVRGNDLYPDLRLCEMVAAGEISISRAEQLIVEREHELRMAGLWPNG